MASAADHRLPPPRRDRLERRGPPARAARHPAERQGPRPGAAERRGDRRRDSRCRRVRFRRQPAGPRARDHGDRPRRDGARPARLPHRRSPARDHLRRMGGLHRRGTAKSASPSWSWRGEKDKWGFLPPGGESYHMLSERVADWLATIERPTFVVSHGGVGRVLRAHAPRPRPDRVVVTDDFPQDRVLVFRDGGEAAGSDDAASPRFSSDSRRPAHRLRSAQAELRLRRARRAVAQSPPRTALAGRTRRWRSAAVHLRR